MLVWMAHDKLPFRLSSWHHYKKMKGRSFPYLRTLSVLTLFPTAYTPHTYARSFLHRRIIYIVFVRSFIWILQKLTSGVINKIAVLVGGVVSRSSQDVLVPQRTRQKIVASHWHTAEIRDRSWSLRASIKCRDSCFQIFTFIFKLIYAVDHYLKVSASETSNEDFGLWFGFFSDCYKLQAASFGQREVFKFHLNLKLFMKQILCCREPCQNPLDLNCLYPIAFCILMQRLALAEYKQTNAYFF